MSLRGFLHVLYPLFKIWVITFPILFALRAGLLLQRDHKRSPWKRGGLLALIDTLSYPLGTLVFDFAFPWFYELSSQNRSLTETLSYTAWAFTGLLVSIGAYALLGPKPAMPRDRAIFILLGIAYPTTFAWLQVF